LEKADLAVGLAKASNIYEVIMEMTDAVYGNPLTNTLSYDVIKHLEDRNPVKDKQRFNPKWMVRNLKAKALVKAVICNGGPPPWMDLLMKTYLRPSFVHVILQNYHNLTRKLHSGSPSCW
jgi:hypothetical protein